jgi:hypothetical protein
MLTNYIVFNFVNMISPCLAGLGFGVAIVCLIKLCYNCYKSSNSCLCHQVTALTDEVHVETLTHEHLVNTGLGKD